jgi:phage-related protein
MVPMRSQAPSQVTPKWEVYFAKGPSGDCYVEDDLLTELKSRERQTLERIIKKLDYRTQWSIEDAQRSDWWEPVGGGLVEMKFEFRRPNAYVRFLGVVDYSASSPVFYVLCGFKKKTNQIPEKHLELARKRQGEYQLIRGPTP